MDDCPNISAEPCLDDDPRAPEPCLDDEANKL